MMTIEFIAWVVPMDMKAVLAKRIEQLGYTRYRVTKEVCQIRAEGGEVPPVTRYNSTVGKALDDPQNVRFYIIEDLVKALDGEIVIRWNNPEEVNVE